jgi:hypothetical protein
VVHPRKCGADGSGQFPVSQLHSPAVQHFRFSSGLWTDFPEQAQQLARGPGVIRVCELGGGANPIIPLELIAERGLEHEVADISAEELAKAPAGYRTVPAWGGSGAAAAMLVTETVFVFIVLHLAGAAMEASVPWGQTLLAPGVATITMGAVVLALSATWVAALAVGLVTYLLVYVAVERIVSPADLAFAIELARQRRLRVAP